MAITRGRDSLTESRAGTSDEPIPLTIVPLPNPGSETIRLVPSEDWEESTWLSCHEAILRWDYDIRPSVNLFFQESGSLGIASGEVTLTERMFMAGMRLPFLNIVREVCTFLGVAPSQIASNGWRYVIASSILWR